MLLSFGQRRPGIVIGPTRLLQTHRLLAFFKKKNKTASEEQSFTKDVLVFCNLGGVKSQMHTKFHCLDFGHKSDNCQLCIFYQTGYDVEGKAYEVPSVWLYMYVLVLLQP